MKRLLKLNVFIILISIVSCKQESKTIVKEINKSVVEDKSEKEENNSQEITESKEQTIEEFLKQLQIAVKNNDVAEIEKRLDFPVEFNWGGESSFYNNYKEIQEDGKFSYILEAKEIEREGEMFLITYQQPNVPDYFVTFLAKKQGNSFKIKTFMQPN